MMDATVKLVAHRLAASFNFMAVSSLLTLLLGVIAPLNHFEPNIELVCKLGETGH